METVRLSPCQHHWRYFVDTRSNAIRIRECERCGKRGVVPTELAPLPREHRREVPAA